MFPPSRAGWRLLNGGIFALALVILGWMVVVDPGPTTIFLALVGLGITSLLMVLGRAQRDDEEVAEREHSRRAAADPIGVLGEDLEQATGSLLRWTRALGVIALVLAVLSGVGACSAQPQETTRMFLSALVWFALAMSAWYVRSRLSRLASLILVAIPAADLIAVLVAIGRSQIPVRELFPAVVMPTLLGLAAVRCSQLTFQYHRRARLVA
jgi:hypothetical protein